MHAYRYKPLSDPEAEIRVVSLQPDTYNEKIFISFQIRRLEMEIVPQVSLGKRLRALVNFNESTSKAESFDYEALSYAWGSNEVPSTVHVKSIGLDRGVIPITRNLEVALRHLRHKSQSRTLWIDALCINQSNDDERSKQVAMMGRIFALASCVVIWLGPEKENSSEALDLMREVAQHVEMDSTTYQLRPSKFTNQSDWGDTNVPLPYQAGELDSVCALLQRPYFERTWVRQEVALATRAYVQCGPQIFPWEIFCTAIACFRLKMHSVGALTTTLVPFFVKGRRAAFSLCETKGEGVWIDDLRFDLRQTKCQDPCDRLYAVLSLLCEDDKRLAIRPDYTRTVEELYTSVTRDKITTCQSLKILETCELSSKKLNLPSWVPDWSSRIEVRGSPMSFWSACCWISAQTYPVRHSLTCVAGIEVSHIQGISDIDIDEFEHDYNSFVAILSGLRPQDQTFNTSPARRSALMDLYCRALVGDYNSDAFAPRRSNLASYSDCKTILDMVWGSSMTLNELSHSADQIGINLETCLNQLCKDLIGRCLFHTSDGHIGLGPAGSQPGDIVCILLGCQYPVVLRPSSESNTEHTWQVVGVCSMPGLMKGEALYGRNLSDRYRSVLWSEADYDPIDVYRHAFQDLETGALRTDPAELLEEAGIKVESYQRYPRHRLEVLPETLRARGINLKEFTLV